MGLRVVWVVAVLVCLAAVVLGWLANGAAFGAIGLLVAAGAVGAGR